MWTFAAMGTEVTLHLPGVGDAEGAALAEAVRDRFAEAEARFSRFLPESELSALDRAHGPRRVSPALLDALLRARAHHEASGGLFDPAISGALVALGYDRSFAPGALDHDGPILLPPRASFREVTIDAREGRVDKPAHVALDLGGLVKGLTVDGAAALLPANAALDAGGDAVLRGAGPDGDGWLVDVEDPAATGRTLLTLAVAERAVATSAPSRRRWRVGEVEAHHLVDPRTGLPARSDLAQVTVLAPSAEEAEVLAKVAFLLGRAEGERFLAARAAVDAVLVGVGGDVWLVGEPEVVHA